jgi:DNA polymerase-1
MKPTTLDAYQLMHEGALALADVEEAGIRIDVERLDQTIADIDVVIDGLYSQLQNDKVWYSWKERWGEKSNLGSRYQLGKVLFEELGYKAKKLTPTGRAQVNEEALTQINLSFVKNYLRIEKLKKLRTTYLLGIRREVVGEYLHAFFNLHLARTMRSSASEPNLQNIPIRDTEAGKLIRSCIIPRDGHTLVEIDYSSLEYRVCACFYQDENMLAYVADPTSDVHRDVAAELFMLDQDDVSKDLRFYAKNQFVFATLYGSYYVNTSKNLWNEAVLGASATTSGGVPIRKHLASKGIKQLGMCKPGHTALKGTFERHVKQVEERFKERFPQWAERKEIWWQRYLSSGSFQMMTGFSCSGVFTRNDLYNYPIQGPAFHLLLWSLIQMVKWLKEEGMKSVVVAEVHDSLLIDTENSELDDVIAKAKQVMTKDVQEHWRWAARVPLEVEVEASDKSWYEKKPWKG